MEAEDKGPGRVGKEAAQVKVSAVRMLPVVTLGMFQAWLEGQARQEEAFDKLEHAQDGLEQNILLSEILFAQRAMVEPMVDPRDHAKLRDKSLDELLELCAGVRLPEEGKVPEVTRFNFPQGYLEGEFPKVRRGILARLAGLFRRRTRPREGWFVVLPVAQLPLRSRMHTDKIRKRWPRMSQEDAELMSAPPQLVEQAVQLERRISRYRLEFERGYFGSLHELVAHVCLPEGQQDYDEVKARDRSEMFKHLPLETAMGVAGFFSKAASIWSMRSAMSSIPRER